MKKLFLLPFLLFTFVLQAYSFEWTDEYGVTWSVYKYYQLSYGGMNHDVYGIGYASNYGEEVVVPEIVYENVDGGIMAHTIEAIYGPVFKSNEALISVSLPITMKYIGDNVFSGCNRLTKVLNMGGVEYIGYYSFSMCTSLKDIDLSSCQNIGQNAFLYCSSIDSIDLSSCRSIRSDAFNGCRSLISVRSLAKCTYIEKQAFANCEKLELIDINEGTTIGNTAFYACKSLRSVGNLKNCIVEENVFSGCSSLSYVDLSDTKTIGKGAFKDCSSLVSVGDLTKHTIIADNTFANCKSLESVNLSNCRTIGDGAFGDCEKLKRVDLHNIKTIGSGAFSGCKSLEEVGDISSFTTIPAWLFNNCTKLKNVNIPNVTIVNDRAFNGCESITTVDIPKVTVIGTFAFEGCKAITSLNLPKVKSIEAYAFSGCKNLNNPIISSNDLISIGDNAFDFVGVLTLLTTTPPVIKSNTAFGSMTVVRVPDGTLDDYRTTDVWKDFSSRIVGESTPTDYDVTVSAYSNQSALHEIIGEDNLSNIVSLKISGDINGYDMMVLRNKMDNLHFLDLTDANIIANTYQYVSGKQTEKNVMDGLFGLDKLISVKLPKSIKSIAKGAFSGCTNIRVIDFQPGLETIDEYAFQSCGSIDSIEFREGLKTVRDYAFYDSGIKKAIFPKGLETIGSYAFAPRNYSYGKLEEIVLNHGIKSIGNGAFEASNLKSITLPEGLEQIGSYAFRNNYSLKHVTFPSTLKSISIHAFYNCTQLDSINLPDNLTKIDYLTFYGCSSLSEIRIPSSITSIESSAFGECPKLNNIFVSVVEPITIASDAFSNYQTATLHVPKTSYYNYWYHPQWSQFRKVVEFDAEYNYFYLNNDFVISKEKGTVQGDSINTDLYMTSGLIIETDSTDKQMLNEMRVNVNGNQGASIITDNNLSVNKMYYDVAVTGGRWYFLSFPFRVSLSNVTAPEPNVWRYYDSSQRALGRTGWKNWTADYLNANQGYIFQASESGTLTVAIDQDEMDWHANNRPIVMAYHQAEDRQNASWNFLGNPHTGYYDIESTGYDQPFTVWNGSSYDAVRAGDDVFALTPLQAFFVQKADNQAQINFPAEGRYTYSQWQQVRQSKMEARRMKEAGMERQIVDLTLSAGEVTDKTRVVYNKQKSQEYELDCDAAKFLATGVPQLYTIDNDQCLYAINERPLGEVRLGYMAANQGFMTISALRMEQPVLLRDNLLQLTHDLSASDYSFHTEAGTFDERFTLILDASTTGIAQLRQQTGVSVMAEQGGISLQGIGEEPVSIYSLGGTQIVGQAANGFVQLPKATYLVKVGNSTTKVIVK